MSFTKLFKKVVPRVYMRRYFNMSKMERTNLESDISHFYGVAEHYGQTWGDDNIHLGFFPHLEDRTKPELTWDEATEYLTKMMGEKAKLNSKSVVIDFGCGTGGGTVDLAKTFKSKITGVDLTPKNIEKCKKRQEKFGIPSNQLDWVVGSFTNLPEEICNKKYDVVFSQLAIYHVAPYFDDVCKQANKILKKGGIFINSDFCCSETEVSDICKEQFYGTRNLKYLIPPSKFCEILTKNGFSIDEYIQMDDQASFGYKKVRDRAKKHNLNSKMDGTDLSKNYQIAAELFERHELGLNLIVARKQ